MSVKWKDVKECTERRKFWKFRWAFEQADALKSNDYAKYTFALGPEEFEGYQAEKTGLFTTTRQSLAGIDSSRTYFYIYISEEMKQVKSGLLSR